MNIQSLWANTMGNTEEETVIGEKSSMKIALVIGIVGALCGAVVWATTVQNKLDEGLRNQAQLISQWTIMESRTTAALTTQDNELSDIKKRMEIVEKFGTPIAREMAQRLTELERRNKP